MGKGGGVERLFGNYWEDGIIEFCPKSRKQGWKEWNSHQKKIKQKFLDTLKVQTMLG